MPRFALTIRNLRGLRRIEWAPAGVSALIGPNGAGKSSLISVLKLLRTAFDRGLPEAVALVFGGVEGLKHRAAPDDEPVVVAVAMEGLTWRLRLVPRGPTVDYRAEEVLEEDGRVVFRKDGLGGFELDGRREVADERLGLRTAMDWQADAPAAARMAALVRQIHVFHDLDTYALRREGSNLTEVRHLHSRGRNALAMLRLWYQERPERWRYQAVLDALKAAFPRVIEDLDFHEAGATVVARVWRPGNEGYTPLMAESNGLVTMLISMCALVSTEVGGVVCIDEAGDAMHPSALRVFLRQAEAIARERDLTVLLSSHNPVLIDHFGSNPERVFALTGNPSNDPVPLTELKDPRYLAQFRLGELYVDGELGSNQPRTT